ncbi:MAG TPA: nucleotidyltransferase domain-containing protein [Anaerolineales bacterium]|nr:nucleotidyltransferase domain-containing protein [Anaerolineales bacterium]
MNRRVPARIRNLMKELKEGLLRIYGDKMKAVYLYGSYARGDYRQGSDVDVMILLKDYKNYWKELYRSSDYVSDISLKYDVTVSCLIMKEIQWKESDMPVLRNIRREGLPA